MIFNSNKEKFIFYNFPVLLFFFIPFFLITGPFLSDLSISLISIFFLIYCCKKRNFSYFNNKYFYFFLIFCFYLIFNSLINNFNLDSLKISFFYFRYGVFVIAVVALLNTNDNFIKYFFYSILICFIILIFDGFYQYFFGKNVLGWKLGGRVTSFFGDEKILGSYLTRLWPIFFAIFVILFKKKNYLFYIVIVIFILSEVLIFISGERAAFFYINFSAIFVILLSEKLLKLRLLILSFSILMIVIISLINPSAKNRIIDHTLNQMNLVKDEKKNYEGIYIFSMQHTHHYLSAYRMFLDNKILGVGVKNFRNFCHYDKYKESRFSCSSHPHNTYIQILTETGIIGFIFLLTVLFLFLKFVIYHALLKIRGKHYFNDFEICILSGIAIYLWPFIPTGNIFNNWLNIAMILNLPFLIWSRKLINT